ncbi:hypothetical protein L210DRAFT_858750 [Boletus edulis BED1]|uniref:Uncharacterized protein n=1 Tax=Boletus edulis BED1 TaxID=1328754 RepID=A0AAD4C7L6_BOLED|nr:hypothetical protein L210DRAFT_858750 [Boletus edulis BED1]
MTHPTKCWRQAKQQQASKVKAFNNGFIQDLPDVALNLDYQPESDVEHSSDTGSDLLASNGMSFSLMDNSDIASEDGVGNSNDDEESDAEITCIGVTGSKRQRTGSHKFTNKATNETDNYVERCAGQAAMAAHQIWMDIHHTVSIVDVQLRAMNDSELTCL